MARGVVAATAAVAVAVDCALAVAADAVAADATASAIGADVLTGLAFVVAAVVSVGALRERWALGAVGAAWLVGSWLPSAASLHQGVLVVALLGFPSGLLGTLSRRSVAVLAIPIALGIDAAPAVCGVFGLVAVVTVADTRGRRRADHWYPGVVAVAVAVTLGCFWILARSAPDAFEPSSATLVFEAVLITTALAFPVAARASVRAGEQRAERAVTGRSSSSLDDLAGVLGAAIGDRRLRILPWDENRTGHAGSCLVVRRGGDPIAVVLHDTAALDDPLTIAAVERAVRLTIAHLSLLREQREQLAELEAARARLLVATGRARSRVAADLRRAVRPALDVANREIERVLANTPGGRNADLESAVHELGALDAAISGLLRGIPAHDLGAGRIGAALASLVQSNPVPVDLVVESDVRAGQEIEEALFYVCAEAVANAVKYAAATRITVTLRRRGNGLEAQVADDGRGGADADGSGLQGLTDRVAAIGGTLNVHSPLGGGSIVSAHIQAVS